MAGETATPTTTDDTATLDIESLVTDGQALLRLRGELDVQTAPSFGEAARQVHADGIPTLVVDLSGLEFIDSTGLRQFGVALGHQRDIGGDLVLHAPTAQTRRVIEIVGLDQILTVS